MAAAAQRHPDVEEALVWALIWRESRNQISVVGRNVTANGTNLGNDVGLGQLNTLRGRGKECGLTEDDAKDPVKNLDCVMSSLRALQKDFPASRYKNSRRLVLAAYNAGAGSVRRCLSAPSQRGCVAAMPGVPDTFVTTNGRANTKKYVTDIETLYAFAKRLEAYVRAERRAGPSSEEVSALRSELSRTIEAHRQEVLSLREQMRAAIADRDRLLAAERSHSTLAAEHDSAVAALRTRERDLERALASAQDKAALYAGDVDALTRDVATEKVRNEALLDAIQQRDQQIATLTGTIAQQATTIAALKATSATRPLTPTESAELERLKRDNAQLLDRVDTFARRLTEQEAYAAALAERARTSITRQQVDLAELGRHALTVINAPRMPEGLPLCTAGVTITAVDTEMLTNGTALAGDFVDTSGVGGLSLPNVFSYTFREFTVTTQPVVPALGMYAGRIASGDTIMLSIQQGPKLQAMQTSLSLKTHRGKLNIALLGDETRGCPFIAGVVMGFLPFRTGQAFVILRANSSTQLAGYLLVRGGAAEPVSLLQFRAERVAR